MYVIQCLHRFQLHDNRLFNQKIRAITPDNDSVIPNFNATLPLNYEASLSKFMGQRVLVNLLQKPAAKTIRNRKRTPNNLPGYLIQ